MAGKELLDVAAGLAMLWRLLEDFAEPAVSMVQDLYQAHPHPKAAQIIW